MGIAKSRRENWFQNMTEEEKAVMGQHLMYVKRLESEDKLMMSGACLDGAFGILVYKADSQDAALKMFENDPLVKSGIVETEFHPFSVGYLQKK